MAGTFCGHSDPPVNTRGHEQIQELFKSLSAERFAGVYSSDSVQRAVTANGRSTCKEIFSATCYYTQTCARLALGDVEGLFWTGC